MIKSKSAFVNAVLSINNLAGETVQQFDQVSGNEIIVEKKDLAPGLYFLRVMQDDLLLVNERVVIAD